MLDSGSDSDSKLPGNRVDSRHDSDSGVGIAYLWFQTKFRFQFKHVRIANWQTDMWQGHQGLPAGRLHCFSPTVFHGSTAFFLDRALPDRQPAHTQLRSRVFIRNGRSMLVME